MKSRWQLEKLLKGALETPAPGKINWTLDIVGQREDGYHLLDSLMQPLALCDWLYLLPADTLSLEINGAAQLQADESNLVLRAARALQQHSGLREGARIYLDKHIPMGAGLGGGSADAAAALHALNEFWDLNLDEITLAQIGITLGADVPFCLMNAPARAQGIGEKLTPIPCKAAFPLVLVQPCGPLSTKAVFEAYHHSPANPSDVHACMEALAQGDLHHLAAHGQNGLEPVSMAMAEEIGQAKAALKAQGAVMAQMSGSGSVVFGAFEHRKDANRAWAALKERYPVCILTETAL